MVLLCLVCKEEVGVNTPTHTPLPTKWQVKPNVVRCDLGVRNALAHVV